MKAFTTTTRASSSSVKKQRHDPSSWRRAEAFADPGLHRAQPAEADAVVFSEGAVPRGELIGRKVGSLGAAGSASNNSAGGRGTGSSIDGGAMIVTGAGGGVEAHADRSRERKRHRVSARMDDLRL